MKALEWAMVASALGDQRCSRLMYPAMRLKVMTPFTDRLSIPVW